MFKNLSYVFLLFFAMITASLASSAPYDFRSVPLSPDNYENTMVTVYNQKTGRTIWKHHFINLGEISWSRDHKALAIYLDTSSDLNKKLGRLFAIAIWHQGQRGPVIYQRRMRAEDRHSNIETSDRLSQWPGYDQMADMEWSPDDRLIALRGQSSGDETVGHGDLWCVEAKPWHLWHIHRDGAGPVWWVSHRHLAYRLFHTGELQPKIYFWP